MNEKRKTPRRCRVCGAVFEPRTHRQVYCSPVCLDTGRRKQRMKYAAEKNEAEERRKSRSSGVRYVNEVLRFAEEYGKRTGHYPHYGEAVAIMEGRKR